MSQRLAAWRRLFVVMVLGFAIGPAAGPHRPGDAGLAQHGRPGRRDHRLPQPGRPALHLQVPVGAADGPLRPALARPAPRLAGADATGAGRHVAVAGRHLAERRHARLRAAGGGGGLHVGVAGRGHRRLPHRLAAGARARPGLVAQRHGLPAGDDPVRRHRADLDRPQPGRRLGLADGLPLHGRTDVRRGRALGHRAAQGGDARHQTHRGAQRRAGFPGRAGRSGGGLCDQRPFRPAAGALAAWPAARKHRR